MQGEEEERGERVFVRNRKSIGKHRREEKRIATQMQDPPSNPNPNPNANANSQFPQPPSTSPATAATPPAGTSVFIRGASSAAVESHSHHRRAHSEMNFRMPDDMMDLSPSDPFNGGSSTASLEEIGSEDDLFSTYIDVEKLGGSTNGSGRTGNGSDQGGYGNNDAGGGVAGTSGHNDKEDSPSAAERPRHRHSSSVDGSTSMSMFGEIMDAKKAMPPDKLAELWTIDPKRAKRFIDSHFSFFFFFFFFLNLILIENASCFSIQF